MEDNTKIKVDWDETKEKLKMQFNNLSCNDLQQLVNKQDAILDKIQLKIEKTKEEIQKLISGDSFPDIIIKPII
ncbi:MAG: hypothetical protein K0Q95_2800 [Bacteroidota bacterium]|jgi:uncharacterized protein YjbJ (UPF0337 family)|nr:hypothetical protein [Bacteroidota bacterium]